jgi:hypothetical protein
MIKARLLADPAKLSDTLRVIFWASLIKSKNQSAFNIKGGE